MLAVDPERLAEPARDRRRARSARRARGGPASPRFLGPARAHAAAPPRLFPRHRRRRSHTSGSRTSGTRTDGQVGRTWPHFAVVRPPYEWLAGSSGAYASVSTTTPPTPSTRNVAPTSPRATAVHVLREERAVASSRVHQPQKSCSVSDGLAVAASTRRARRPRSPRSTRPSSAAAASRSARSSAWSSSTESPAS